MKKIIFGVSLLAILALLAACGATSQGNTSSGTTSSTGSLSGAAEMLVGTMKLEDTDHAVTADQAKQLLPLWETLQTLSSSSTAASEEVNALVDQIKGVMTTQQINEITAMKLTQEDMMSMMSQSGFNPNSADATTTPMALNGYQGNGNGSSGGMGPGGNGGNGGPSGAPPSGGGMPSGGMPSGGGTDPGMMMGGTNGASSTPQAVRPNAMGDQVPQPLFRALIDLLQKKVQ